MRRTIALLTDFGTEDTYVGVMKGVMRGICPDADFVDLIHDIQPQNVREAALALMSTYAYFPAETVFLVVVDPGVGGGVRRAIAVRAGDYMFVAPDNGVLTYALADLEIMESVVLTNERYQVQPVSLTFHGRDIFSPAAAHLADGVALAEFGKPAGDLVRLSTPVLVDKGDHLVGEVMHIDHFGNVVTSIGNLMWVDQNLLALTPRFGDAKQSLQIDAGGCMIEISGAQFRGLKRSYGECQPGEALALVGSSGFLELAINQGNYARESGSRVGDQVKVRR